MKSDVKSCDEVFVENILAINEVTATISVAEKRCGEDRRVSALQRYLMNVIQNWTTREIGKCAYMLEKGT